MFRALHPFQVVDEIETAFPGLETTFINVGNDIGRVIKEFKYG
jgi:hypothetical protein